MLLNCYSLKLQYNSLQSYIKHLAVQHINYTFIAISDTFRPILIPIIPTIFNTIILAFITVIFIILSKLFTIKIQSKVICKYIYIVHLYRNTK